MLYYYQCYSALRARYAMSHLPQELEEELEVESLLRHALLPLSPLTRASGYTNEVWIGESYVVRLNGGRLRDSLRHERDVLVFLPDDIPHAKPLAYGRREHRGEYLILERLPGRNLDEVWGELSIDSRKSAASQLATFVQKLHSLPFSQVMGNPWLQLAIDNCLFGDAYHAHPRHFMQQIQGAIGLSDLDRGLIREVQQLLETRLSVFDDALDVFVHSDIHFRNVLWYNDHITGLLDFEGSRPGPADLELDTLIRYIRYPEQFRPNRASSPGRQDLVTVLEWILIDYPGICGCSQLVERLEAYEAMWQLVCLHHRGPDSHIENPVRDLQDLLNGVFARDVRRLLGG